jgi:hypothetical protein
VLCGSQLLVYASGKYWIELGYLLLAAGLMAALAFDAMLAAIGWLARAGFAGIEEARRQPTADGMAAAALAAGFILLYPPYALAAVSAVLDAQLYRSSTQLALDRWARDNISRDQVILFDAYAYFDPHWFRRVIRSPHPNWPRIAGLDPDYLMLSSWVYDSPHYRNLIRDQSRERDDTYLFSVRVYQDLLKTDSLGPTDLPGIDYAALIKPATVNAGPGWVQPVRLPGLDWATGKLAQSEAAMRVIIRKVQAIWSPPKQPVLGAEFRIYRFSRPTVSGERTLADPVTLRQN